MRVRYTCMETSWPTCLGKMSFYMYMMWINSFLRGGGGEVWARYMETR